MNQPQAENAHVYDTPTGEHPAVIEMRERTAEAVAQGYQHGDVNHFLQPIIGVLRLRRHNGKPITDQDIDRAIEAMSKACRGEVALLAFLHPEQYDVSVPPASTGGGA